MPAALPTSPILPPDTVELPHLRAIPGSAVLHPVPPRYRPRYALATVHIPVVQCQTGHHCIICGAPLPPWRDLCPAHEPRQGHGMPPRARLQAF